MAELIREIIDDDISRIKEMLKEVFGDEEYIDLERLGGMTNRSYKVVRTNGKEYICRIPGEGTDKMINRSNERKNTVLACDLGVDTKLLYFTDDGKKVMEFVQKPQPMNKEVMQRSDIIKQATDIIRKLHTCGIDTSVRFDVFEMAGLYEKIIKDEKVAFYDDYEEVKNNVMSIKNTIDEKCHPERVFCHNDTLPDNWVLDENGKLYLVDWEYSGMNEGMWDLSCLSIESDFSNEKDNELLKSYYGREASTLEKKYFVATKLYVDYLWTLWGLVRVPVEGTVMQEYADGRYERLKRNIEAYKKID